MESNKREELTCTNLSYAENALSFWVRKAIQGFIDSGIAQDLAQAVRSDSFSLEKTVRGIRSLKQYGCSDDLDVTLEQALTVMSQAPANNSKEWEHFFDLMIALSANSKFFVEKSFSWETRDLVRTLIGLPSLHSVYKNTDGDEVLFQMTGYCPVWVEEPKGYRYADTREIPVQAVKDLDCVVTHIYRYGWVILKRQGKDIHIAGKPTRHFFLNKAFCIPLVKIKK